MSEELAPDRLEALLRGEAGVSGQERRIGALLDELTMGEIAPPAALLERVRGVAAAAIEAAPETHVRRRPRVRRRGLRLAPVLGVAATLAVVAGVAVTQRANAPATSTPNPAAADRQQLGAAVPASGSGQSATRGLPLTAPAASKVASVPAPDGRRAQDYAASLRLAVGSVAELSRATQTVLESVRSLGGAVESVDYGTPSAGSGSALIELRIPVGRAQEALRQFSALGTITSQQVQIRDLQASLDEGTNRARALRRRIALLQAKLLSPVLTPEARATLESRLADSQSSLASVLRGVHATQQRAAFARFSLALVTGSGTPVAPAPRSGAFARTASNALDVISVAGRGALFAAIVGGPFLLLAGGAWWLSRRLRRRAARRLLESS